MTPGSWLGLNGTEQVWLKPAKVGKLQTGVLCPTCSCPEMFAFAWESSSVACSPSSECVCACVRVYARAHMPDCRCLCLQLWAVSVDISGQVPGV